MFLWLLSERKRVTPIKSKCDGGGISRGGETGSGKVYRRQKREEGFSKRSLSLVKKGLKATKKGRVNENATIIPPNK